MTNFTTTDNAPMLEPATSTTPEPQDVASPTHPHLSAQVKYVEDPEAFGYQESGRNLGDPTTFENFLGRFESGAIIDASQDEEANLVRRQKIEAERDEVLSKRLEVEAQKNQHLEVYVPAQEQLIANKKAEIEQLTLDHERGKMRSEFKPVKVGLLTSLFVCNLMYLLLFYANLLFTIFFKNYDAIIKSGQADLNTLLGTVFDPSGIFTWHPVLIFCYLAPTLFLTLGLAPHLFLNVIGQAHHQKWVKLGFYVLAFIFDALLAYQLESKAYQLRKLMGMEEPFTWYASSMFWIVLGFGFLAYVVCGFLAVVVEKEFEKRDNSRLFETKLGFLQSHIAEAQAKIIELQEKIGELNAQLGQIDLQLDAFKRRLEAISLRVGSLQNTLQSFYSGWLRYLNNGNHYQKRAECEERFQAFLAKNTAPVVPSETEEVIPNGASAFKRSVFNRVFNSFLLGMLLCLGLSWGVMAQKQWVVALDLSDRLVTTPHCADNDQKVIMQAFNEFEAAVRRSLIINSKDVFMVRILPQKNSPFDGHDYEQRLSLSMPATSIAERAKKLQSLKKELPALLRELYQKATFSDQPNKYYGVDIWLFFNDVLPYLTPKGYQTQLVLLSDGHFDFESYQHTVEHHSQYTHTKFIRTFKGPDWKIIAEKQGAGILPISRKIGGVSVHVRGLKAKTNDIFELDKLRFFWGKWLRACGIQHFEVSQ